VVDPDVVLRKAQAIEHHAARLRDKLPLDSASLASDESLARKRETVHLCPR